MLNEYCRRWPFRGLLETAEGPPTRFHGDRRWTWSPCGPPKPTTRPARAHPKTTASRRALRGLSVVPRSPQRDQPEPIRRPPRPGGLCAVSLWSPEAHNETAVLRCIVTAPSTPIAPTATSALTPLPLLQTDAGMRKPDRGIPSSSAQCRGSAERHCPESRRRGACHFGGTLECPSEGINRAS